LGGLANGTRRLFMTIYPVGKHTPPPRTFENFTDVTIYVRDLYDTLLRLRQGKTENVGQVTLTALAATTVIKDVRISPQSVIVFDPLTQNAALELAAGTMYILAANRIKQQVTVTHANGVSADRTFYFAVIG
jgi:hypothetical protein